MSRSRGDASPPFHHGKDKVGRGLLPVGCWPSRLSMPRDWAAHIAVVAASSHTGYLLFYVLIAYLK